MTRELFERELSDFGVNASTTFRVIPRALPIRGLPLILVGVGMRSHLAPDPTNPATRLTRDRLAPTQ